MPEVPRPPSWQGLYLAEPHGDEEIAGAHPEQPGVLVVVVSRDTLQGTGDRAVSIAASHAGHAEGTCASPAVVVNCPRAEHAELRAGSAESCPGDSAVGTARKQ